MLKTKNNCANTRIDEFSYRIDLQGLYYSSTYKTFEIIYRSFTTFS